MLRKIIGIVFLIILLVVPVFMAYADTSPPALTPTPADGSNLTSGTTIKVSFNDPDQLNAASIAMTVNGQPVTTSITYNKIAVGYDSCGGTIYQTDYTSGTINGPSYTTDGTYNVTLTVADKVGNVATLNWSFFIGYKPTITSTSPANGQRVGTLSPSITVVINQTGATVSENMTAVMSVNGADQPVTLERIDTKTWNARAQLTDMPNETLVAVSLTATNSRGQSVTKNFSFIPTITPPEVTITPSDGAFIDQLNIYTKNNQVKVRATDVDNIDSTSVVLKVYDSLIEQVVPHTFKYDTIYEYDTCGYVISETTDYTNATITGPELQNGTYRVTAIVKDGLGNQKQISSTFILAVPPKINSFSPKNNEVINTKYPVISYNIDAAMGYGIDPARTVLKVNGNQFNFDVTDTGISAQLPKLGNERKHNVSLLVYANDGLTAVGSSGFWVNTYGEMAADAVNGCGSCHTLRPETKTFDHYGVAGVWNYYDDCSMCHGIYYDHPSCNYCHTDKGTYYDHNGPYGTWGSYPEVYGASCLNCHSSSPSWGVGFMKPVAYDYPHAPAPNSSYPYVHKVFSIHNTTFNSVYGGGEQCNDCHSKNLTRTHLRTGIDFRQFNKNCVTCHKSTDTKVQSAVAVNNTSCSACHDNVSSAIHTPAHAETVQRDACYGCHNKYIDDEHMKNTLDTVVSTAPTRISSLQMPKCIDCHEYEGSKPVIAAINGANGNCTACHDSFHLDQNERHAAPSEFIPSPIVTCTACHDTNLTDLHNSATTSCESCHRTDLTTPKLDAQQIKQAIYNADKGCNKCHDEFGTGFHNNLDSRHTAELSGDGRVECTTCHSNVISSEHLNGNIAKTIKGLNYNCDSCHVPQSANLDNATVLNVIYEGYTMAKADPNRNDCAKCHMTIHPREVERHATSIASRSIETDKNCTLCHEANLIDEHDGRILSPEFNSVTADCNTCHTKGGTTQEVIDAGIADRSMTNIVSNNDCVKCHNDANDIHKDYATAHKTLPSYVNGAEVTCSSCHGNDDLKLVHQSLSNLKLSNVDCLGCHNSVMHTPDGGTSKALILDRIRNTVTNEQFSCSECHAEAAIHPQIELKHEAEASDISMPVDCTSCHDSNMKAEHINKAKVANCDTCHTDPASNVKDIIKVTINDDIAKANCIDCHTGNRAYHTDLDTPHQSAFKAINMEVNCSQCHDTRLQVVHGDRGVTCNQCHTSSDPIVKDAITQGARDCTACHTEIHPDREVMHEAPFGNPAMACDACHKPNLMDEHLDCLKCHDSGTVVEEGFTCNTCHTRGDERTEKQTSEGTIVTFDVYKTILNAVEVAHNGTPVSDAVYVNRNDCAKCHDIHLDLDTKHVSGTDYTKTEVYCGYCHDDTINTEHDADRILDCRTCHKEQREDVVQAVENELTDCSSCHGDFRTDFHADLDTKHGGDFSETHLGVTCTACHTGALTVEHKGLKPSGNILDCNACHGINNRVIDEVYNKEKNCNLCHTPHQDIVTPHTSIYVPDKAVDCSLCHSEVLQTEHSKISGFTCDSCHTSTDPAVKLAIDNRTSDCNLCHGVHLDLAADHQSGYLGDGDNSCALCHSAALTEEHNKVSSSGVQMDCNTCHESQDVKVDEAIQNGRKNCNDCHIDIHGDPTVVHQSEYMTDTPFDCSACHQPSLIDVHADRGCAVCHQSVDAEILTSVKNGNTNCDACHRIHQDTSVAHRSEFVTAPKVECISCHRADVANEHTRRTVNGIGLTCKTCHDSEDNLIKDAIKLGKTQCNACHSTIHPNTEELHKGVFPEEPDIDCTLCHDVNLEKEHLDEEKMEKREKEYNCNTCHSSTASKVKNAITTGNKDCSTCHEVHIDLEEKHEAEYTGELNVNCFNCHDANMIDEHEEQDYSCTTCHESEDEEITEIIIEQKAECNACHEKPHRDYFEVHATTFQNTIQVGLLRTEKNFTCTGCHVNNLVNEHLIHEKDCNACHSSQDEKVNKAIAAQTSQCSECHKIHEDPAQAHRQMYMTEMELERFLKGRFQEYPSNNRETLIQAARETTCLRCHNVHFGN